MQITHISNHADLFTILSIKINRYICFIRGDASTIEHHDIGNEQVEEFLIIEWQGLIKTWVHLREIFTGNRRQGGQYGDKIEPLQESIAVFIPAARLNENCADAPALHRITKSPRHVLVTIAGNMPSNLRLKGLG